MTKILLIHNTAMWYRRPFFKILNEIYNIKFVFTHIEISGNVYGVELSKQIDGLECINYKILNKSIGGITFELLNELVKNDCDVIVDSFLSIESIFSFIIAKLRCKSIIFWSEEWDWQKRKSMRKVLFSPVVNFIASHSDAILVPGSRHKEYFKSLGTPSNKIFIMPNVSNILIKNEDYANKNKLKNELNIGSKKVILYVGRLRKRKGVEYLVKGFAKLRNDRDDVVLIIVGRGECRNELESLSENLSLDGSIYFRNYVEDELLPAYYMLSNICVVPSITHKMGDPWVFTVNEAMYFGKPVIATDAVGAAFDMIKEGENGFVVPEKDSDALYEAMKKIISDPELEKKMADNSRKIIEDGYKYENMVDKFKDAIEFVLDKRKV